MSNWKIMQESVRKRIVAFALCIAMVLALAGLGGMASKVLAEETEEAPRSQAMADFGEAMYDPALPATDTYMEPNQRISMSLVADERNGNGVLFDVEYMYYQLPPSGVTWLITTPADKTLILNGYDTATNEWKIIRGFVSVDDNGLLELEWDKTSPGYYLLPLATNAMFSMNLELEVDGSGDVIDFDADHRYYVDNTADATFTKSFAPAAIASLVSKMTAEEKAAYAFTTTLTMAKTAATADGETLDERGMVRDSDGHIVYETKDVSFTLADMTYDATAGHYKIFWDNLKPDGSTVTVTETAHKDYSDIGYTYATTTTTATTGELKAFSSQACSLANEYTQDQGTLKITKSFADGSDITASNITNAQKTLIKITVTGTTKAGEEYSKTFSYANMTGGVYTISNIPAGTYTVTETATMGDYYWTSASYQINGDGQVVVQNPSSVKAEGIVVEKADQDTVALTNTYIKAVGSLTLNKTFAGDELTEEKKNQATFTIKSGSSFVWFAEVNGHYEYVGTSTASSTPPSGYTTGTAFCTFTYADMSGGSINFSKLPVGTYTVNESKLDVSGYTHKTTVSINSGSVTTPSNSTTTPSFSTTISKDTNTQADVTNTYEENGKIKVTKTFSGYTKNAVKFQLQSWNGSEWVNYGSAVQFSSFNGSGTTRTREWTKLPFGTYRVVETDVTMGNYIHTSEVTVNSGETKNSTTSDSFEINSANSSANVNFKNTYVRKTGDLELKKVFAGDYPLADDMTALKSGLSFSFKTGSTTVRFKKTVVDGVTTYAYTTATSGSVTSIPYSDMTNGSVKITGLPVGNTYTVTEVGSTCAGYDRTTVVVNSNGTVSKPASTAQPSATVRITEDGQVVTASFTNSYEPVCKLRITKKFTGVLSNDFCNEIILPALRFTIYTIEDGVTYYVTDEVGTLSNNAADAREFEYSELAGNVSLVGDKTYYVEESNKDVNGQLSSAYKVTTWATANGTLFTNSDPQITIAPAGEGVIHFTNDYRSIAEPGIVPGEGAGALNNFKTWTGLDNGPCNGPEGTVVKDAVRFELYRQDKSGTDFYLYDTYTLPELVESKKWYEASKDDENPNGGDIVESGYYSIVLPSGTYKLVETDAAYPGYEHEATISVIYDGDDDNPRNIPDKPLSDAGVIFTVGSNEQVQISIDNVYIPLGELIVTKTLTGNLTELTDAQRALINFTVFNMATDTPTATETFSLASTGVEYDAETNTYSYTLKDLPVGYYFHKPAANGNPEEWTLVYNDYRIEESNAIAGYDCATTVTVVKTSDKDNTESIAGTLSLFKQTGEADEDVAEINFTNEYTRQTGSLEITKTFGTADLPVASMDAVTFQILNASKNPVSWDVTETGNRYSATGTTNSFTYADMISGSYAVSNLPTGTYYVKETNADMDTYLRTTKFTVSSNGGTAKENTTTTQGKTVSGGDVSSGASIQNEGNASVTVSNTYVPVGELKFEKHFTFLDEASMSQDLIEKMTFSLYDSSGNRLGSINLGSNGVVKEQMPDGTYKYSYTVSNLPVGTYKLVESNADHPGYTRTTTVVVDGKTVETTVGSDNGTPEVTTDVTHNATKLVEITNSYSEQGGLTISKTFRNLPNSLLTEDVWDNIVFAIRNSEGELLPNNEGKFVTNAAGEVIGTVTYRDVPFTKNGLPAGTYTVTETIYGESNNIADTDSIFYGYTHNTTSYTVSTNSAADKTITHGQTIDPVTATGTVGASGAEFAFTNTYAKVPRMTAEKASENYPTGFVTDAQGNVLPVWRFTVNIRNFSDANVINGQTVINDVFDLKHPEWFKLCVAEDYQPTITGGSVVSSTDNGNGSADFVIATRDASGNVAPKSVSLTYYLQVKDKNAFAEMLGSDKLVVNPADKSQSYQTARWQFTNTITYHPLPNETETDTSNYYYNMAPIQKEIEPVLSSDGSPTSKVNFKLLINQDALRIGTGNTLTVYDKMSDNVVVDMTSFKVEPVDQTANVKPELYTGEGDWDLIITIPNEVALTITYTGTIVGTGTQTVTNLASVEGIQALAEDDIVITTGGSGTLSIPQIYLFKYGNAVTEPLEGAVFDMYEAAVDENHELLDEPGEWVATYTSDAEGYVIIRELANGSAIEWETLYYLEEKQAPKGYAPSTERLYFCIVEEINDEVLLEHPYAHLYNDNLLFTNKPFETAVSFSADKVLQGKPLQAEQFTLQLLDDKGNILQSVKNDETGLVTFEEIQYTYTDFRQINPADNSVTYLDEMVHTYTIREAIPSGTQPVNGYIYDPVEYTMEVTVKLNADQTALEATPVYKNGTTALGANDRMTFTNAYTAMAATMPAGTKTVANAAAVEDTFSFVIEGADNEMDGEIIEVSSPVAAASNQVAIPYPMFQYVLDPNADSGMKYDAETNTITLTVKSYEEFARYATEANTANGDYVFHYRVKENAGEATAYAYDSTVYTYTIGIRDNGDGTMAITPVMATETAQATSMDFTNTFYGNLKLQKNVTVGGEPTDSTLSDGDYTFKVYTDEACTEPALNRDGEPVTATLTIANGVSSTATLEGLVPGDYYVREEVELSTNKDVVLVGENPVKVTVPAKKTDDTTIPVASFTNNRNDGSLQLTKTVVGTTDDTKSFTFTLTIAQAANRTCAMTLTTATAAQQQTLTFDANGQATVTLRSNETVIIDNLPHGAAYKVEETEWPDGYTPGAPTNGEGTIDAGAMVEVTQQNLYATEGVATLSAKKAVTGNEYTGEETFTFTLAIQPNELTSETNNVLVATAGDLAQSVANGVAATWQIQYDTAGTYYYIITETKGQTPGMAYDTAEHYAKVVVVDNGNGSLTSTVTYGTTEDATEETLTITNKYSKITFQPEVQKQVTGANAPEETFHFSLIGSKAAADYADEASCVAGESAQFKEITYHTPGIYEYTITETAGKTPGMTYQAQPVICTVEVSQANDGTLTLSSKYVNGEAEGNTFTNVYEQPEGGANIAVTKALTGNDYAGENQFTFVLTAQENELTSGTNNVVSGELLQTISVDETAAWNVQYDQPGTYYYTIQETAGAEAGMAYDETVYHVTVVMAYSEDGKSLVPTVTYGTAQDGTEETLTITNKYSKITFQPEVQKQVTGANAPEETFHFSLIGSKAAADYTDEASCVAGESAQFKEITYHTPGIYEYTITETAGKTPGMTYQAQPVICTVEVSQADDGTLTLSSKYANGEAEGNTFTNVYEQPEGGANIAVTKALTGNDYAGENQFSFVLTAQANELTSGTNNVVSGELTQTIPVGETAAWNVQYDQPGTYYYTIQETAGAEAGMAYDETVYHVTVVMAYSEDGKSLVPTVTYGTTEDATEGTLTITNKYSKITFQPEVQKQVTGANAPEETFHFSLIGSKAAADYTDEASCVAGESAQFNEITYHTPGIYEYTITETAGKTPGMTYQAQPVICTVEVSQADDGTLTLSSKYANGDAEGNTFTNVYEQPEGGANIAVTKALTGNDYAGENQFSFVLTAQENELTTETNNVVSGELSQTIPVGEKAAWSIDYDQPGTYYYTIQETAGAEAGMAYDETVYHVTVVMAYSEDGKSLVPTVTYGTAQDGTEETLTITNKYSKITFQPEVQKQVTGANAPEETFHFSLIGSKAAADYADEASCVAGESAQFKEITYHTPGIYEYTITETAGKTPGMTYQAQPVICTVEVSQTDDGTLTLSSKYANGDAEGNTFTNEYIKPRGKAELTAEKAMTGNLYEGENAFDFVLAMEENELTTETNNVVSGELSQTIPVGEKAAWSIDYDEPGTYYYTIQETVGTEAGMTYDGTTYYVTVVMAYSEDGKTLVPTVTYGTAKDGTEATLTITNKYSKITFQPEIQKQVTGEPELAPEETFTFELIGSEAAADYTDASSCVAGATAQFKEITYTEPGTYVYTITETAGATPGMTYSAEKIVCTVVVARAADGTLTLSSTYANGEAEGSTFTNEYIKPRGKAELTAEKAMTGNLYEGENAFDFVLAMEENELTTETNNVVSGELSQTIPVGEKAAWSIDYDEPGTYYYTIQETVGTEAGMTYDGTTYYVTVVMAYSEDGKTLVPTVTYGTAQDGTEETLTITNKYSKITFQPEVQKQVTGEPELAPEETFTFELIGSEAAADYTDASSCVAGATAQFKEITYTEPGTYVYTITETAGATPGMTYSAEKIVCTVVVARAADGTLTLSSTYANGEAEGSTFTNEYIKPRGKAELTAEKAMTGNLYEGENAFDFVLAMEENELTTETNNVVSGELSQTIPVGEKAAWSIDYDEPGTYYYTIQETVGTEAGMTYDGTTYYVTVVMAYSEDGKTLVPTVTYGTAKDGTDEALTITNKYSKITFQPEIQKLVTGEVDKAPDETFSFTLTDPNGKTETLTCENSGKVVFTEITYHVPGIYTYTITETAGKTPGMTYQAQPVICTVEVTKADDGTLALTHAYTSGADQHNVFTNNYVKPRGKAPIAASKAMTGNDYYGENRFTFTMGVEPHNMTSDENNVVTGELAQTIPVGGEASWTIDYDEPGTYYYTIQETVGTEPGVTYDGTTYYVTVVMNYSEDGKSLVPTVTYGTDRDASGTSLTITNQYSQIFFQPVVNKRVLGENAPDETFQFHLTDERGYTDEASCKAGEKAWFHQIVYHKAGIYTYTITEIPGQTPDMTYWTGSLTCRVEVERAADGTLTLTYEYQGNGDDGNTITNTYGEIDMSTTAEITVDKAMSGNLYEGADAFTFTLTAEEHELTSETNNVITGEAAQTVPVGGKAVWNVAYDQPGTYYYTIQEMAGNEVGVTYDDKTYYATVVVQPSEDGSSLTSTVTYGEAKDGVETSLTITNCHSVIPFQPYVQKIVKGSGAPDEVFNFILSDGQGYTDEASCRAGEKAWFSEITYYQPGTYTYTIREAVPSRKTEGMRYSDEVVTLIVTVEQAEDGTLSVTADYKPEAAITNTYTPPEDPGYDYKFTFKKKWQGGVETSIEWTLYNPDGTVAHKKFNKQIVSETEWHYEAWFANEKDYYLVEKVPEGYTVTYVNVGEHAGETDRLYNGGTIINSRVPETGDSFNPLLWVSMLLVSAAGMIAIMFRRRRAQR